MQTKEGTIVKTQRDIECLAHKRSGIPESVLKESFNAMWEAICEILESNPKHMMVKLHGKGKFKLAERGPRPGRNPKTGEEFVIDPHYVMAYGSSGSHGKRLRKKLSVESDSC